MGLLVFQDWMFPLTMQQQSVLLLACRGPDGIPKFHPTKEAVVRYRASVLKAASLGRAMHVDEGDDTTFMSLRHLSSEQHWEEQIVRPYFDNVDSVPHHYTMHLLHGAQIIGYKHPITLFRKRRSRFYLRGCEDMHMSPESEADMDERLSGWHQKHWDTPTPPHMIDGAR